MCNLRGLVVVAVGFMCVGTLQPAAVMANDVVDPGGIIEDMVADPVRDVLYASLETNELIKVSFASRLVTGRTPVSGNPEFLAIAPDGSRLFVTLEDSYDVAVFSLPGLIYQTTYALSATARLLGIAVGSTRLFSGHDTYLSIVDLTSGTEVYYGSLSTDDDFGQLELNPDESRLISVRVNSDSSIEMTDVSKVPPVWIGDGGCFACAGTNPRQIVLSPDGSMLYIANGINYDLRVLSVPESGQMHVLRQVPTHALLKALAVSMDGQRVFIGLDFQQVVVVRTSDWLPFRVYWVQDHVTPDFGLAVSADGGTLAVALRNAQYESDRIEIIDVSSPIPNRGGMCLQPVDELNGLPVARSSIFGLLTDGHSGWVDLQSGILCIAPMEEGTFDLTVTAPDYEQESIQTVITGGNWTDNGGIVLTRMDDFPAPAYVSSSPGVPAGDTVDITLHGRSFHPDATVTAWLEDWTIESYAWVNWSTIDIRVTAPSTAPVGPDYAYYVANDEVNGYLGQFFVLPPPVAQLEFRFSTTITDEDVITVDLEVLRTNTDTGEVSVDYQTLAGTATAGQDFTTTSGTLTWLDGESDPQVISVPILQDTEAEGSEDFTVELSNVIGGELGAITEATVTIIDDDVSYLQFEAVNYGVDEDAGPAQLTVTRTVKTDVAVSVDFSTSDGTAAEPGDYTLTVGTLSWVAGDSSPQTIDVPIIDDLAPESNETLTVTLDNPSADAVLGDPSQAVVTIVDDDGSVFALMSDTIDVNERDGSVMVSVLRTNSTSGAVSVDYATGGGSATAGQDYTAAAGTLSWADGDGTAKSFGISILEDGLAEPDETVNITLSNPTGPAAIGIPGAAVLTIGDNDGSSLEFSAAGFEELEDAGSAGMIVRRVGGSGGAASVNFAATGGTATPGVDYNVTPGTLSWADGDASDKTITVNLIDDGLAEQTETVTIALSAPIGNASLGAPAVAALSILDDESIEWLVNTTTENNQSNPHVAMNAAGAAVVVWESWNQDGSGWGIFGQRLNAAGGKAGGEFQVNGTGTDHQLDAAVAMAVDGGFIIVWEGVAGTGTGIFGRRFNASGSPLGGDFAVNTSATGTQTDPQIAVSGSGQFLVVWQGVDANLAGVFARAYSSDGAPVSGELAVNTTTSLAQGKPAVAGLPGGGFVVVWESYGQDGSVEGIVGRRFDQNGSPLSAEFGVNNVTAGSQTSPAVAAAGAGTFVVAWAGAAGQDGSGTSIQGRWFDSVGSPVGDEFTINSYTTGNQGRPAVGAESLGRAIVAWESFGQDGSDLGVFARFILDDGTLSSDEYQLNTHTAGQQYLPAVACANAGRLTAVWASQLQDGSGDGVYGTSRLLPSIASFFSIFTDGFESGDTLAWSASTP